MCYGLCIYIIRSDQLEITMKGGTKLLLERLQANSLITYDNVYFEPVVDINLYIAGASIY